MNLDICSFKRRRICKGRLGNKDYPLEFYALVPEFFSFRISSILNLVRNLDVSAWDVAARTLGLPTWLVVTHPTVKYQGFRKLFPSSSKVTTLTRD